MFAPGTIVSECVSKKGKQIVFRLPLASDAQQLCDYINRLSREDTFISYSGEEISLEQEQEFLDKQLDNIASGNGFLLVVEYEKVVIGVSHVTRMGKRSNHVGKLYIGLLRGFRNEGIGTYLLDAIVELAKKIGLQMIELEVYSVNAHALSLYKKFGFKEVGVVPKKIVFHGELVDEVILIKYL